MDSRLALFSGELQEDSSPGLRLRANAGRPLGGGAESYPERPGVSDCVYFLRTGFCVDGSRCRFNHPRERGSVVGATTAGRGELPERVGQPVCQYYLRTGTCRFGAFCKFHHPRRGVESARLQNGEESVQFLNEPSNEARLQNGEGSVLFMNEPSNELPADFSYTGESSLSIEEQSNEAVFNNTEVVLPSIDEPSDKVRKIFTIHRIAALIGFGLEAASAVLEQISNELTDERGPRQTNHPKLYILTLLAAIFSLPSLLLALFEMMRGVQGSSRWVDLKVECLSVSFALAQTISSLLQFIFIQFYRTNNPIRFSFLPLIFALIVLISSCIPHRKHTIQCRLVYGNQTHNVTGTKGIDGAYVITIDWNPT